MSVREPSRVIVWALPRTTSTALAKSITARQDIKCYFEPYAAANHFGPDGSQKFCHLGLEEPNYTFDTVKRWLEDEHCNIFVKDIAYVMQDRFHAIPEGYKHTFLIRTPEKVFSSLFKMFDSYRHVVGETLHDWLSKQANLYKSLTELFHHIEINMKGDVCIIDSDDIRKNPAQMIEKYCKRVGFEYSSELLRWQPGVPENWCIAPSYLTPEIKGWFEDAFASSGWKTDDVIPSVINDALPDDVMGIIQDALPYYEKFRSHPNLITLDSWYWKIILLK